MTRTNLTGAPALLQKLFYHAQRNPIACRYLFPGALLMVVRREDSFPQIQGKSSHEPQDKPIRLNGYSFI
ncbi:MAG: hypothetical protein ACREFG_04285 [Chthoniobacterales bacterium]